MEYKETMGKRISELRKNKGMTQEQLAQQVGVTAQAVSKWENDLSCPDISILPQLAEALDHIEWANQFRADGFSASINAIIVTVTAGLGQSIILGGISALGYIYPEGGVEQVIQQPESIRIFFICLINGFLAGIYYKHLSCRYPVFFSPHFIHTGAACNYMYYIVFSNIGTKTPSRRAIFFSAVCQQQRIDRLEAISLLKILQSTIVHRFRISDSIWTHINSYIFTIY